MESNNLQPTVQRSIRDETKSSSSRSKTMTTFNLTTAIETLLGFTTPFKIEYNLEALVSINFGINLVATSLRDGDHTHLTPVLWLTVDSLLYSLSKFEEITPEINCAKDTIDLRQILAMISKPSNNFPLLYQQIATHLTSKFDAQNRGEPRPAPRPVAATNKKRKARANTEDSDDEEELTSTPTTKSKRSKPSKTAQNPEDARIYRPAPINHPIYGLNGIMHHMMWRKAIRDGYPNSYKIDPDYARKSCTVFGHNGLKIGDCWPRMMCALRDGAHGDWRSGIHGSPALGAYSILITQTYEDFDDDTGNMIWYSQAHADGSKQADLHRKGSRALLRSIETSKAVRVLRKQGGKWSGCPSVGARYDGLYKVVEHDEGTKNKGDKFARFKLIRLKGQDEIREERPTEKEKELFVKEKLGY